MSKFFRYVFLSQVSLLSFSAQVARAQTIGIAEQEEHSSSDDNQVSEITVTGTRIVRDGYKSATPVAATTTEDLTRTTPTTIADGLIKMPQFTNSEGPRSFKTILSASNAGNTLNLRGLGTLRTLVLLDGMRLPPTFFDGTVDTNIIPNQMVQRVDIVTGGASASYGADAVAGVVNYVLDKKFKGVSAVADSGVSERGDNFHYKAGLAGGFGFADGRGHVLLSAEIYENKGMRRSDRLIGTQAWTYAGAVPGSAAAPGTEANPFRLYSDVRFRTASPYGLVTGPTGSPFVNTRFLPDGNLTTFEPGAATGTSNLRVGGDGWTQTLTDHAITPLKTQNGFGRVAFEVTPDINIFVQGAVSRSDLRYQSLSNAFVSPTPATIFSDNPYLAPSVQSTLGPSGSLQVAWYPSFDGPNIDVRERTDFWMVNTGIEGKTAGLSWNVSYAHGSSKFTSDKIGLFDWQRAYAAIDAVRDGSGRIVCRASLSSDPAIAARFSACRPMNFLGVDPAVATPDGYAYATGTSSLQARFHQDSISANLSGDLFSLPAGPVSFALGGEWRRQSLNLSSNSDPASLDSAVERSAYFAGIRGVPSSLALPFWASNASPASGAVTVKEGYAEISVPVFKNAPFARSLEVNLAGRAADYSSSGTSYNWKAGIQWQPIDDVRVRANLSQDSRAPSLNELFAGGTTTTTAITDPVTGLNNLVLLTSGGNPNLKPERGRTLTVGGVLDPSFLPGFKLAIDYYRIKIDRMIGTATVGNILQNCFAIGSSAPECALIVRPAPNQFPTQIFTAPANFAYRKTSGIDFDASYRSSLGNGELGVRLFANYLLSFQDQANSSAPLIVRRGKVSFRQGSEFYPKISANLNLTYNIGGFTAALSERYIGSAEVANLDVPSSVVENGHIAPEWYTDVTLSQDIDGAMGSLRIFLNVSNLFDNQPPIIGSSSPGSRYPTVPNTYDIVGRAFTVGVKAKF